MDLAFAQRVRTMQIIAFALVTGCVVFLAIVLYLRLSGQEQGRPPGELPLITILAAAFSVVCLAMRFILPDVIVRKLAGSDPSQGHTTERTPDEHIASYQTTLIICMALVEGPTFFAIVAYMLEGHVAALVLSIALILILALHFPTAARVAAWIKRRTEDAALERRSGTTP